MSNQNPQDTSLGDWEPLLYLLGFSFTIFIICADIFIIAALVKVMQLMFG